ncbi:hypothetical protein ACFXJ8_12050 [Nonomuraea sp. NPDC059194]|uniref:hypothetical protein n=1 Tax=Nonomuraea sp. NPDC059194 TaxID=3346764 RepID=UPI0036BD16E0
MNKWIKAAIAVVLIDVLAAYSLMRILQVLHDEWSPAVPTMGFWTALFVIVFTWFVLLPFRVKGGD